MMPLSEWIELEDLPILRNISDVILLYKLVNGTIDCSKLLSLIQIIALKHLTRSVDTFVIDKHTKNYL